MYIISNNTVVPVAFKDVINEGLSKDGRIALIEQIVSEHFDISIYELDNWYDVKFKPAKIMCCFLLHDLCNYSVRSLALKYRVYKYHLKLKISEYYMNCLQDEVFMANVTMLRNTFVDSNVLNTKNGIKND